MPTDLKKSALRFFIIIVIAFITSAVYFVVIVPRNAVTKMRMEIIRDQILNFDHVYHRLPISLNELVATNGDPIHTLDGWGHPIQYLAQTNGMVLLKSAPTEIELSFSANDTNGESTISQ
jgi:hypothetical protein